MLYAFYAANSFYFVMSGKVNLPHHSVVIHWKEGKVLKWLEKVNLVDCIPAFEARHINGKKLLELTEQILFTYQDLKIKHRKQIAKCVQECKSQASNAKKIAKTLKQKNGGLSDIDFPNGVYDSDEDSDIWGSEFDDSEDELKDEYSASSEVNNNSIIQSFPGSYDAVSQSCPSLTSVPVEEKTIPKPPDVPVISKSVINSSRRPSPTSSIPRPPIKRPPSQPPPPPVQQQVQSKEESQVDYEIPIFSEKAASTENLRFIKSPTNSRIRNSDDLGETYEIVQPPEENYEIIDTPVHYTMNEKPVLPPRQLKSGNGSTSPPPLPQKPQRLKDSSEHGIRTFSRPKLPNENSCEGQQPVAFVNSLMHRTNSNSSMASPVALHRSKDELQSFKSLSDSFGSSSSLSEKEVAPVTTTTKPIPIPLLSSRGTPVSSPDETASKLAQRPLPPVPGEKDNNLSKPQLKDIMLCPWYQEIEREAAEAAVKMLNEAGSFVVRPSKRAGKDNPFSLTVMHEDKLFHLNIRQRPDKTFALGREKEKEKTFSSVSELITFHLSEPILLKNRGEPAGKTILRKYPEKAS